MSELEQELMQTSEVETGSEIETPTQEVETGEEAEQIQEEIWKQDKRFGSTWKSPDDVYNSVKYYEQKFDPIRQTLEKSGFADPQKLEQVLNKYPEYEQSSQLVEKLNTLLQHEVYGPKLQGMFKEIQQGFERDKYGTAIEDLPPHIQEQLRKVNDLETKYQQMEEEKTLNTNVQTIHSQMDGIQKLCADYGFELDAQTFLQECQEKGIPPSQIKGYFFENNFQNLVETAQKQASLGTLNKNKELKTKSGYSSQKTVTSNTSDINSFKDLRNELLKE
jgi:hypothetical protein